MYAVVQMGSTILRSECITTRRVVSAVAGVPAPGKRRGRHKHTAGDVSTHAPRVVIPSRPGGHPMQNDLWRWDAVDIAAAIRTRKISSREAVQSVLARLDAVNPALNALRSC